MISAKEAEFITGSTFPEFTLSYPVEKRVVFMPRHPNMKNFFNKDYCYTFVHPGFCIQKEKEQYCEKNRKIYGDYNKYRNNVTGLMRKVCNTEPSLFLVAIDDERNRPYPVDLLPPERSMTLLTYGHRPWLLQQIDSFIQSDDASIELDQDQIYSYFKENGIKEVRMCGEFSWTKNNVGCVADTAKDFKDRGFRIKGVKGCMFPYLPPREYAYNNVTKELFRNQVVVPL